MTGWKQTLIPSDGVDLHVQVRGAGSPLLLLHGLAGTGDDWQHVFELDDLAPAHRVMPDARSHGRSTNPTGGLSFRA
jgi:pimeloyl-ACP methyl ester carboxylesterase